MPNRSLIPIQVNSCYQPWAEDRRQGCLATWLPLLDRHKFCPVFVTGNPSLEVPFKFAPPFLIVRAPDTHDGVAAKVKRFLEWALTRFDCPWLFKCDDDSYINPRVFNDFPFQNWDYVGRIYAVQYENTDMAHDKWKAHGAGYSLSRRCAEKVLAQIDENCPTEDTQVGQIVKQIPDLKWVNQNGTVARIGPWSGTTHIQPGWMLGHMIYGREEMMAVHQRVYQP